MTTNDLIKLLQKIDPDGTTPVCVDNADVDHVIKVEAYWDGKLQQLVRDENNRVVGARITTSGDKVRIYTRDIEELLYERPETPVSLDTESAKRDYEVTVEKWRE